MGATKDAGAKGAVGQGAAAKGAIAKGAVGQGTAAQSATAKGAAAKGAIVKGAITKSGVRALVEAGDERRLLALFDEDPSRVRRYLKRLVYARDETCRARALDCFGMLTRERSDAMPEFFREVIRRCLWEMNEEGGNVAWSAPELIGAVIVGTPERFGPYFSYMAHAAVDEPTFQPGLIAAFDAVLAANPVLVQDFEGMVQELREARSARAV